MDKVQEEIERPEREAAKIGKLKSFLDKTKRILLDDGYTPKEALFCAMEFLVMMVVYDNMDKARASAFHDEVIELVTKYMKKD